MNPRFEMQNACLVGRDFADGAAADLTRSNLSKTRIKP